MPHGVPHGVTHGTPSCIMHGVDHGSSHGASRGAPWCTTHGIYPMVYAMRPPIVYPTVHPWSGTAMGRSMEHPMECLHGIPWNTPYTIYQLSLMLGIFLKARDNVATYKERTHKWRWDREPSGIYREHRRAAWRGASTSLRAPSQRELNQAVAQSEVQCQDAHQ